MTNLNASGSFTANAETAGYPPAWRLLHWTIAAIVLAMIPMGIIMANGPDGPTKDFLYNLHRSLGVTLIPLILVRLVYRLNHTSPSLPPDLPALQKFAARATHYALYALLLVQPFVGWIATSAYPAPILVFGLFQLPPIWRADRPFSDSMFFLHRSIGLIIALLVAMHIAAALYHHFIRRDDVLLRMIRG